MVLTKTRLAPGAYEIIEEGKQQVLRINYLGASFPPSVEHSKLCMNDVVDKLIQVPSVNRVLLSADRNYIYDESQTQMLREIANLYVYLTKQKKFLSGLPGLSIEYLSRNPSKLASVQYVISNLLKSDPIGAYVEIKRMIREQKIKIGNMRNEYEKRDEVNYLKALTEMYNLLDRLNFLSTVKDELDGYIIGDRSIYANIFRPIISPNFMLTRLMAQMPLDAYELDNYNLDDETNITIFSLEDDVKNYYHLSPPEFNLEDDKIELIELARNILAEHQPEEKDFTDPDKMRKTFFNIGRDLLMELANHQRVSLDYNQANKLAEILVRYTVGFGLLEVLLKDEKIQDIVINGPIGQSPIYVVHQDYDECATNIIPSGVDGEAWATRFRMISGRPLDQANPVLDTELIVPGGRARVAIIGNPLNPEGLGYALRRHRDNPWTLPLFIQNKTISPLGAGLLSFLIDRARSILVAGTRSSGKTSLLGSFLVEIMRKFRVITVEDSVAGDSEIYFRKSGKIKRKTIGKLIDSLIEKYGNWYNLSGHEVLGNDENIEVLSMNKNGKIEFKKITKFIRHKVKKPIYKVLTRTGREIKVTGDHSLFSLGNKAQIKEVKANLLKKGDFIATPRKLNFTNKERKNINLLDHLDRIDRGYFFGEGVNELFNKSYFEIKQLGKEHGHNKSLIFYWKRNNFIPVKIVRDLDCLGHNISSLKKSKYKTKHNSKGLPVLMDLDKDFLTFVGLWLADGCYDRKSIILSVVEEENRDIAYNLSKRFGFNIKMHSDSFSLILNSVTLRKIMRDVLDLKGNAYTKRVPGWIFNLSDEQISYIVKGIFSGDGCFSDKEIIIPLSSLELLKDIQTLLLKFGVILRIGKLREDKTYNANISSLKFWRIFRKEIGVLPQNKIERLNKLCLKKSTHDSSDVIPLTLETKEAIKDICNKFNFYDYAIKNYNIGREKLSYISSQIKVKSELVDSLRVLSSSNIFWDQIKDIKVINDFNDYVYDISVSENESFVTNNIIAHNTLELPVSNLRRLGYNIQPMKVRAALSTGGSEMAADEGIRTSLRLGDSSLIVGEVRSKEALALYEAMRVGALANVVAGTIHGGSPYAVYDRVVNDLGVPRTSFKATDIIVIVNPIKTPDGLHKIRRVLSITEVRKHWEDDPLKEGAFVDLMRYNSKTDMLEPTDNLINGDSEVIKEIASNVKEWAGDWDAVWENIQLRADIKESLVKFSEKMKMPKLLEAKFIVVANDMFHKFSDQILEKEGKLDNKKILFRWNDWVKKEAINYANT